MTERAQLSPCGQPNLFKQTQGLTQQLGEGRDVRSWCCSHPECAQGCGKWEGSGCSPPCMVGLDSSAFT